jgi:hypothetical protein
MDIALFWCGAGIFWPASHLNHGFKNGQQILQTPKSCKHLKLPQATEET